MRVGVVGLGLIGGSLALALRDLGHEVWGSDHHGDHEREALARGLVSVGATPVELAKGCDMVAVAVPVDRASEVCAALLDVDSGATVFELGSTKGVLAKALAQHAQRGRLVLSHPMAGTEFSGPSAALPDLYRGKTVVLCDREATDPSHFARAEALFGQLGMSIVEMGAEPHDLHVAYVSHISHISSFALSLTVLNKERDERQIFNLAAGGFASTVRLAKSNPATWVPILLQNREHVTEVLDEYLAVLQDFRASIAAAEPHELDQLIRRANHIAAVLPKSSPQ